MEAKTCEEIDIAGASISSDEEFCEDDGTRMSDLVVSSFDSISYHSAVSETERLHRSQGLQRHYVTNQLKVSDSDISSALGHHDVVRQMLATSSWGAPMFDERANSTLSLAEVHALREAVRILNHNYSQLIADQDYLLE